MSSSTALNLDYDIDEPGPESDVLRAIKQLKKIKSNIKELNSEISKRLISDSKDCRSCISDISELVQELNVTSNKIKR